MECTQRLEYTQDLYEPRNERICSEQIGFLGICGEKYPVKKGPNKIGRDPTTCSIVINLNSVSRQHAVINVLNHHEFMLMDLDSANKTKLMNNILQPYIPHPLKNGDMVQFGDIFGVFRLLEEDNDLPMTQALDIPDTPIATRNLSKVARVPITTIPESPDVSDRDDSFIAPSQPKNNKCFKNSNSNFIKPSSHTIAIQPVGSNKIDNVYWHSSKKSLSLNSHLDDSNSEMNKSNVSDKSNTDHKDVDRHDVKTQAINDVIHNMETQDPFLEEKSSVETNKKCSIYDMETQAPISGETLSNNKHNNNSIYDMETQVAFVTNIPSKENKESIYDMPTQVLAGDLNESVDSIYAADTQILGGSPSIHSLPTQLPQKKEGLPEVRKIDSQHNMQLHLYTSNKNKEDIYDAETQMVPVNNLTTLNTSTDIGNTNNLSEEFQKTNKSDEEIIFDEMYTQNFDDNFDSQPLLPPLDIIKDNEDMKFVPKFQTPTKSNKQPSNNEIIKSTATIIDSDNSTDCEDIAMLPTQKITRQQDDDDLTDCEDLFDEMSKKTREVNTNKANVDFEDMLTQVIDEDVCDKVDDKNISDLPTQIISTEDPLNNEIKFEDLPTQVLDDNKIILSSIKKPDANLMESPFKIPLVSPLKVKRKDIIITASKDHPVDNEIIVVPDEINYYSATQDIVNDLCSQKISSPDHLTVEVKVSKEIQNQLDDDEFVPCSVEDYKVGPRFPHLDPPEKFDQSFGSSECEERIDNFVSKLSNAQIRDVIGVDNFKKIPSDLSESVESTPKKVRPIKFMDIDLPDSQEIKTGVTLHSKLHTTESSSDSEPDNDSEEQYTPILFKKKKTKKNVNADARVDLTKKFDIESLPTRVITRVRKPTSKLQNSGEITKTFTNSILKPKFLTEQEEEIDKDIIKENISRLKSKNDKNKHKDKSNKSSKRDNVKGKENDDIVVNAELKPEVSIGKGSSNKKDDKKTLVTEKVKANLVKLSNEKYKATESTKIEKNNKRESRQKKFKEVPSEIKKISGKEIEDCLYKAIDQSDIGTRSTRSTRARRRENAKEITHVEDYSQEIKPRTRKDTNKKPVEIDLTIEPTADIRRSKRQRTSKDKKDINNEKPVIKSILKKDRQSKHEQSTVYNISGSGTDTPKAFKRSSSEFDLPSSKRTRSSATLNITTSRSTPVKVHQTHYVLFTAFPCEEVRVKLEKLGAVVVTDVKSCTVVLTLQIKRTFKLLCAVGLGKPIVGPEWVQACADNNMVVDPWLYILKDEAAENRFKFSLEQVLRSKRNFLKGFHVSSTPSVMPNATEMKLIVECSGGIWKEGGPQWICVSCTADKTLWPALKRKGAVVVATEFILAGVLRQKPDITANKL